MKIPTPPVKSMSQMPGVWLGGDGNGDVDLYITLSNGPYKKDSATRRGMQKGADFCTTLLLLYHTSESISKIYQNFS